jgi:hypothetical protein
MEWAIPREVDVDSPRSLSGESGGRTFIAPEIENGSLLSRDALAISGELRRQYNGCRFLPRKGDEREKAD